MQTSIVYTDPVCALKAKNTQLHISNQETIILDNICVIGFISFNLIITNYGTDTISSINIYGSNDGTNYYSIKLNALTAITTNNTVSYVFNTVSQFLRVTAISTTVSTLDCSLVGLLNGSLATASSGSSITGTIASGQVAVGGAGNTIQGSSALTFDGTNLSVAGFNLGANSIFTGASSATNTTGIQVTPNVADGASSVAFDINNATTLSSVGGLLFRVRNNGTDLFHIGDSATNTVMLPQSFASLYIGGINGTGSAFASTFDRGASGTINIGTANASQIFIGNTTVTSGIVIAGANATNTTAIQCSPRVTDGASSIAFDINNTLTLSTSGAALLRLRNNGVTKATVDFSGSLTLVNNCFIGSGGNFDVSSAGPLNLGLSFANRVTVGGAGIGASGITLNSGTGPVTLTPGTFISAGGNIIFNGSGFRVDASSGTLGLGTSGATTISVGSNNVVGNISLNSGTSAVNFTYNGSTSGSRRWFYINSFNDSGVPASTETNGVLWDLSATRTWTTSLPTTQREVYIKAPTYASTVASTITTAATVSISGAPIAGTNATISNAYALNVESGSANFAGGLITSTANITTVQSNGFNRLSGGNVLLFNQASAYSVITGTQNTAGYSFAITPSAAASGTQGSFEVVAPASTGQTLSTEINSVLLDLSATRTWATGGIATQREFYVKAPTYSFVGASTIATAATLAISGAPTAGTNATITESIPLLVNNNNIGAVSAKNTAEGIVLQNNTAATSSVQQNSPILVLNGQGWSTTSTASMDVRFAEQVTVASGAATPSATWHLYQSINGASYTDQLSMSSGGTFIVSSENGTVHAAHYDRAGSATGLGDISATAVNIGRVGLSGNIGLVSGTAATTITGANASSGAHNILTVTMSADTGQTASTEVSSIVYDLSATKTWATGAIATQREYLIKAPTYAFAGASTITTAATVSISGAPIAGTNATITNGYALNIESGNIGLPANANIQSNAQAATNTTGLTITSNVADGASSKGIVFNNATTLSTTGSVLLSVQNNGLTKLAVDKLGKFTFPNGGNIIDASGNAIVMTATSAVGNFQFTSSQKLTATNKYIAQFSDGYLPTGALYVGATSGAVAATFCYAEGLTCSGTVTAGQIVVWNGSNLVSTAAATNNLTSIAGVAITGGTNALIVVARHGRCLVNADAGITAGQLVGTSSAVAGNCQSGATPGAGAILGRACEATAGTVAGQVIVDLILG